MAAPGGRAAGVSRAAVLEGDGDMLKAVVADDSVLLRTGIVSLLRDADFEVVGETDNTQGLLALVAGSSPDVATVDIRLPPTFTDEGLRAAAEIRARYPRTGVLVLSQYLDSTYATRLFTNGARGLGYLLKENVLDRDEFVSAVRRVATGRSAIDPVVVNRMLERRRLGSPIDELTERQRLVLGLMAQGRSNQAIGERLFLTSKTVEAHIHAIFEKLDLQPTPDDHRRVLAVLTYLRS